MAFALGLFVVTLVAVAAYYGNVWAKRLGL
jgi:hypothetical protein